MLRRLRPFLFVTFVVLAVVIPSMRAQAADAQAQAVAENLREFTTLLDSVGTAAEFAEGLPYMAATPQELLQLDQLFAPTLGQALDDYLLAVPDNNALAELANTINTAGQPVGDVMVNFQNAQVAPVPGNADRIGVAFNVVATRTVQIPVAAVIETTPLQRIQSGEIELDVALTAAFQMEYNTQEANAGEAFYLTNEPTLTLSFSAGESLTPTTGRFGFTEVSVSGNATLNMALVAAFQDPDDNLRLTRTEWENTILEDLLTIGYADQPGNDVDITLNLNSDLTTGTDGTIQLVDTNLADGLSAPSFNFDPLTPFLNVNQVDVLGSLSQLEGILTAAQFIGDLPLPMLGDKLSDVFSFTEPLLQFIKQQGDAAVLCGQTNTNPPLGILLDANSGDKVYCRAITFEDPISVTWNITGGTSISNTTGADALTTVGINPTANATFELTSSEPPTISVDFTDPDGTTHTVYPLFLTTQELQDNLQALGGFDTAAVNYNETTNALTFRLQKSLIQTDPVTGTLDFGNYLQAEAGLFGLGHDSSAAILLEPANAQLDVTFGILLGNDDGGADVSDRFFIQVQDDAYEFSADTALTVNNLAMEGRLGFLKVTAAGSGPSALTIAPQNPAEPMVGVNLNPGDLTVGATTIPNAARLNDIITDFASKVDATCNVGVNGGLNIAAALNNNTADVASGSLTFAWPNALTAACVPAPANISVTPSPEFSHNLTVFDLDPNNPAALLSVILDNLELLSAGLNAVSGGDIDLLDTELPIIGENPRALVDQLTNLQETVNDLRLNPPNNLQELETDLEAALGVNNPSLLGFELLNQTPGGSEPATLIVHIGYDKNDTYTDTLKIDLGDTLPDLVSLESGGHIDIGYDFQAQLDLGIPLETNFDPGDIYVADSTGISLTTTVNANNLSLTASIGPLSADITGTAKLGAGIGIDVLEDIPISQIASASDKITAGLSSVQQDCGEITDLVDGLVQLEGGACANLGVSIINSSAGNVGFYAPDLTNPGGWDTASNIDLENILQNTDLSLALILEVLPKLMDELEDQLYNGANLPIVGQALDGGAQVVEALNDEVIDPLEGLADELEAVTNPAQLTDIIRNGLADVIVPDARATAALGDIQILDRNNSGAGDADDIEVLCNGVDCALLPSLAALNDVRVVFHIGQGVTSATDTPTECPDCLIASQPFDLNTGLPGLPLEGSGTIAVRGGWKLRIDFGLSRNDGPYLGVQDPTLPDAPELELGVGVGLGDHPNCNAQEWAPSDPFFNDFSDSRCLHGVVGFLQADLFDGAGGDAGNSPTKLALETSIELTNGTKDRVPLSQLGSLDIEPAFEVTANMDLRFRTGISDDVAGPGKLPSIIGVFHLDWQLNQDTLKNGASLPTVEFDHLWLDAGGFISDFAGPALTEVKKITSPIKPVIDTLQAPLPGISQLAELVGEDPVSLLDIAKEIDPSPEKYQVIERLIDVIKFVNQIPADDNIFIPLGEATALRGGTAAPAPGSFKVNSELAKNGPLTPDQAGALVGDNNAGSDLINQVTSAPDDVGGLSFPFLEGSKAAENIFGLLMGQDITLIYFDAGTLKATASYSQKFGPIFVGPIPITIGVHGSASIEGHFAMGYDTAGIRKIFDGGSVTELQKGIFIDDLKDGVDVPEIRLQGTIAASASIDAVIAEVGVKGGIILTVDMNLDDSPDPDGKLRIDEIVNKLGNPFCLFEYSGSLDAFISAFARVGIGFLSKTFELEIVRIRLLEFSGKCQPAEPKLYEMDGTTLILKMGAKASGRNVNEDEPDEEFTVRQLSGEACARFSVTAFGIHQDSKKGECFERLVADGGTGTDVISLLPGVDEVDNEFPFDKPATIYAGSGNDRITTGWGNDIVCGGSGADRVDTSKGTDTIYGDKAADDSCALGFNAMADGGNDENDNLSGGNDVDTIYGGGGDDQISGGPAGDNLYGQGGNDTIQGGPSGVEEGEEFFNDGKRTAKYASLTYQLYLPVTGHQVDFNNLPTENPVTIPTKISNGDAQPDGADLIVGGPDADVIAGHQSADFIYGDEQSDDCDADGAAGGGEDEIYGGPGDDHIWGGLANDKLVGEAGHDTICGNGGNDVLDGDDEEATTNGGNDILRGGNGHDELYGRAGDDDLFGNDGTDTLMGGNGRDDLSGGLGTDTLDGGSGRDYLFGDEGFATRAAGQENASSVSFDATVGSKDIMNGRDGHDVMYGEGGPDEMFGDAGEDVMHGHDGDDLMRGGQDNDQMHGNNNDDEMYGDSGADIMYGDANDDIMRGGIGDDEMYGGDDVDTMYGDSQDDYMEGNNGVDTMYGNTGQDDMMGGSALAGAADAGDYLYGGDDHDVLLGDNGTIIRSNPAVIDPANEAVVRTVTLFDLASGNNDTAASGEDELYGEEGDDALYGGGEGDIIEGNNGHDYAEGNGGVDTINGNAGQDDLIGGTSVAGTPDAGDTIHGNGDYDVILGDNGTIVRVKDNDGLWVINSFNDAITRIVVLYDVATVDNSVAADVSGDDYLYGDDDDDLIYGQGDNDHMWGGNGDDYMEGNNGGDEMYGDAGNDDMVGGTGRINDDPPTGTNGRLDSSDTMHGGDGFDVMAGDNAILVRTLVNGQWVSNGYNAGIQHEPRILLDEDSPDSALVSAGDFMYGEGDDDQMYGQGGNDQMWGGDGQDIVEGNGGQDTIHGDEGQDDLIGGSTAAGLTDDGDFLYGEEGHDVIIGDNGQIDRPLDDDGDWLVDPNNGAIVRLVTLFDVETTTTSISSDLSGGDELYGDDGDDDLFGQGDHDELYGGDGADYLEGNHGDDELYGGADEDELIGGGSANDGIIDDDRMGDGLFDGQDLLYGGGDGDVMAGDNARILRLTHSNGFWQIDPNSNDVIRDIQLFDVETVDDLADPRTSGSDTMYGENGRDLIFGQGNDATDDDGDGIYNEDPADGIDNDRDGRESSDSDSFDCTDGRDNDGDGKTDSQESSCTNAIDEDGGGDVIYGGNGDDYIEGNHGSDWLFGEDDQDDIIGGNSAGDGHIFGGVVPDGLTDGYDTIHGGEDADTVLGDNGMITRPVRSNGLWRRLSGYGYDIVVREVYVAQTPEEAGAFGNDYILGEDGPDELTGLLGDDYIEGNDGDDVLVGDIGLVDTTLEDGSRETTIASNSPFLEDVIYEEGTLHRAVTLYAHTGDEAGKGDDILLGGDDDDAIHGGPGDDIMNGNNDEDHIFGGDGNDVAWGGPDHDHLYGGHGDDYLDVKPREERWLGNGPGNKGPLEYRPADPSIWFAFGTDDNYQDLDTIYGGWDRDAMQANLGRPGPRPGDRLVDWAGAYNVYYVCPAAYGEGVITRSPAPHVIGFLQQLAEADGAVMTATNGTSGFRELGIVFPQEIKYNSHPPHPDHVGHFTCN